jgi:hypothetical protein
MKRSHKLRFAPKRSLIAVLAAVGVATAVVGFPSSAEAVQNTQTSSAQMSSLTNFANGHHGLGVYQDSQNRAVVRLAKGASVPQGAPVTGVKYTFSRFTSEGLNKATDEALALHKLPGNYSVGAGYDPATDTLDVMADAPADKVAALTAALAVGYAGAVKVHNGTWTPTSGRFSDVKPFWGGDRIISANTGAQCTSGFSYKIGALYLGSTAAHCMGTGEYVYNATTSGSWGNYMGYVADRYPSIDFETLYESGDYYGNGIWTGGTATSTSSESVVGSLTPTSSMRNICISGTTTFNRCDKTVTYPNLFYCPAGGTCVSSADGFGMTGGMNRLPGDSGAPVFESVNGTAYALGTMSATYTESNGVQVSAATKVSSALSKLSSTYGATAQVYTIYN